MLKNSQIVVKPELTRYKDFDKTKFLCLILERCIAGQCNPEDYSQKLIDSQLKVENSMRFEDFKAGHWQQRFQYKSFEPTPVNHDWTWEDTGIHVLLESANRALGELNALSPSGDLGNRLGSRTKGKPANGACPGARLGAKRFIGGNDRTNA